jgi:hypothetical protein
MSTPLFPKLQKYYTLLEKQEELLDIATFEYFKNPSSKTLELRIVAQDNVNKLKKYIKDTEIKTLKENN